jgi:hypothetical protein
MNRGRVGEERGSKETDRCPLTMMGDTNDVKSMVYVDNKFMLSMGVLVPKSILINKEYRMNVAYSISYKLSGQI